MGIRQEVKAQNFDFCIHRFESDIPSYVNMLVILHKNLLTNKNNQVKLAIDFLYIYYSHLLIPLHNTSLCKGLILSKIKSMKINQ